MAHRLSLSETVQCPDDSLFACHHCDNPPCVNPDHLYWGTAQDNIDDMIKRHGAYNKGQFTEVCKYGHRIEGENLRIVGTTQKRMCRTCDNDRKREAERRKRRANGDPIAKRWSNLEPDDLARALKLIAGGGTMREVATYLGFGLSTVEYHLPREPGYRAARDARRVA